MKLLVKIKGEIRVEDQDPQGDADTTAIWEYLSNAFMMPGEPPLASVKTGDHIWIDWTFPIKPHMPQTVDEWYTRLSTTLDFTNPEDVRDAFEIDVFDEETIKLN